MLDKENLRFNWVENDNFDSECFELTKGVITAWVEKIPWTAVEGAAELDEFGISEEDYLPINFAISFHGLELLDGQIDETDQIDVAMKIVEDKIIYYFSSIIEAARNHFLNTFESDWGVENVLKLIINDQQERHTGSNIGGTDIREVSKGEVKREEEV